MILSYLSGLLSASPPPSPPPSSPAPSADPPLTSVCPAAVGSAAVPLPCLLGITTENTSRERNRRVRRRRVTAQMVAGGVLPRLMVCGRRVLPGRGVVEVVEQPASVGTRWGQPQTPHSA